MTTTTKTNSSLIFAIDQGTSSSRVIVFRTSDWDVVALHQVEFDSLYPEEGWCEQDPMLILQTVKECINGAVEKLQSSGYVLENVKAIGITNQRETTVAWDKLTGEPLHNAIVWHDARTKLLVDDIIAKYPEKGQEIIKDKCGLPISTYFSASKMKWMLDNVPKVKKAGEERKLNFGTIDTWLMWNLTKEKSFVTDVTNASRTMLMDINSLKWSSDLCQFFGIDMNSLPEIKSSSDIYGYVSYSDCQLPTTIPFAGCLGDQQAALVGQKCFHPGMAKNTYGTGCFMLYNVGPQVVYSKHGLLSTVAYQFGPNEPPTYALEGSVAVAGSAIKWLSSLGIISSPQESEELASKVEDTGDVYFVPAFNGLFAPHWRTDARGVIVGLTQYTKKEHICRATLEAVAFQVYEILISMEKDSGKVLQKLQVDGGMTKNELLMQIQADFNGIEVVRPKFTETTSMGAAMAAAKTVGLWSLDNLDDKGSKSFKPTMSAEVRNNKFQKWEKAISRSLNWNNQ